MLSSQHCGLQQQLLVVSAFPPHQTGWLQLSRGKSALVTLKISNDTHLWSPPWSVPNVFKVNRVFKLGFMCVYSFFNSLVKLIICSKYSKYYFYIISHILVCYVVHILISNLWCCGLINLLCYWKITSVVLLWQCSGCCWSVLVTWCFIWHYESLTQMKMKTCNVVLRSLWWDWPVSTLIYNYLCSLMSVCLCEQGGKRGESG